MTKSLSQQNEANEQEIAERISRYINAATRENTRKTYRSAVEHFEVHWGGKLPTTPENIGRYLVSYADRLAPSTLKTRLAALSQWHKTQGFVDPVLLYTFAKSCAGSRQYTVKSQSRLIQYK